jgi:pimeloyl-ACP methyl ester carboxylesterase
MSSTKPLILVVPGAWHLPSICTTFCAQLQAQGYPVACYQLPSTNLTADPVTASAEADTALYRKQLLQHLSHGQDIIVVAHSYGAIPGFGAAIGLSKTERSRRREVGGVIGLVGVAAVVAPEGKSSLDLLQSTVDPSRPVGASPMSMDVPSPGWAAPTNPAAFLDDGVQELLKMVAEQMLVQIAVRTMFDDSLKPAWVEKAFKGKIA